MLVTIREATHATHNAKNVVVHGKDGQCVNTNGLAGTGCCVVEHQLGGVNATEIACTTGLVFLRSEGKAVHTDGIVVGGCSETGVGVPDLVAGEIGNVALGEAIGSVKDDLGCEIALGWLLVIGRIV